MQKEGLESGVIEISTKHKTEKQTQTNKKLTFFQVAFFEDLVHAELTKIIYSSFVHSF